VYLWAPCRTRLPRVVFSRLAWLPRTSTPRFTGCGSPPPTDCKGAQLRSLSPINFVSTREIWSPSAFLCFLRIYKSKHAPNVKTMCRWCPLATPDVYTMITRCGSGCRKAHPPSQTSVLGSPLAVGCPVALPRSPSAQQISQCTQR